MSRIRVPDGHVLHFDEQTLTLVDVHHPRACRGRCMLAEADRLGTAYLDHAPESIRVVEVPDWPSFMVSIGTLEEIVYSSRKWDGKLKFFHHKFGRDKRRKTEKPTLAVHPLGSPLFIVGGDAHVDERGIVC